jgi:hypothetical protein
MTREYIAMFYCIFTILLLAERNGVENRMLQRELHLGRAAITKKITDEKFLSNMKFHSTVI